MPGVGPPLRAFWYLQPGHPSLLLPPSPPPPPPSPGGLVGGSTASRRPPPCRPRTNGRPVRPTAGGVPTAPSHLPPALSSPQGRRSLLQSLLTGRWGPQPHTQLPLSFPTHTLRFLGCFVAFFFSVPFTGTPKACGVLGGKGQRCSLGASRPPLLGEATASPFHCMQQNLFLTQGGVSSCVGYDRKLCGGNRFRPGCGRPRNRRGALAAISCSTCGSSAASPEELTARLACQGRLHLLVSGASHCGTSAFSLKAKNIPASRCEKD